MKNVLTHRPTTSPFYPLALCVLPVLACSSALHTPTVEAATDQRAAHFEVSQSQVNLTGLQKWYRDADNDTWGDPNVSKLALRPPSGYVAQSGDCDDSDASAYPSAQEECDGEDDDCDGLVDDGVTGSTWYRDADGDGYGTSTTSTTACAQPSGYVSNSSDCNDADASVKPGATEIPGDSKDQNCDGQETCYKDADNDGYRPGTTATVTSTDTDCADASEAVSTDPTTDCNDSDSSVKPGAYESCNGKDDDCDGLVDEGVTSTWYRDADGDFYGTSTTTTTACALPSGYAANSGDCNDADASVKPGATEVCDGKDNNCDSRIDEGLSTTQYARDVDGDGWGNPNDIKSSCSQPAGYVYKTPDCNDNSSLAYPGAVERKDGIDNDCDRKIDEVDVLTYGGGYGHSMVLTTDGRLFATGRNLNSELSDPSLQYAVKFIQIEELGTGVSAMAVGRRHNLAVKNGAVYAWGYNNYCQAGGTKGQDVKQPTQISSLTNIKSVSAGYTFSLALDANGNVYSWGHNEEGELGNPNVTISESCAPVQVSLPGPATAVSAGVAHGMAIVNGKAYVWGSNSRGQIGINTYGGYYPMPQAVSTQSKVKDISAGNSFSMALLEDSTVWTWGDDYYYQLGSEDAVLDYSMVPVPVGYMTTASGNADIAAGHWHSLRLESYGGMNSEISGSGRNTMCQLGLGHPSETEFDMSQTTTTPFLSIASGREHGLALDFYGNLYTWGANTITDENVLTTYGQLGRGNTLNMECSPGPVVTAW